MSPLPFAAALVVPALVVAGNLLGGWANLITPLFVFVAVPILDRLAGEDRRSPEAEAEARLEANLGFRALPILAALLQPALVAWGLWRIVSGAVPDLDLAAFTFALGVSSGAVGITVSHELLHRVSGRLEPLLARLALGSVLYAHWAVEHLSGHHSRVGTPEDPATARRGESSWAFVARSAAGGLVDAWRIEAARLSRKGQVPLGPGNRVLRGLVLEAALVVLAFGLGGLRAGAFLVGQALVAIVLLELVNYVEHYGLLRTGKAGGGYEKVGHRHSWNSSRRLTNRLLFNLQRHSDHHWRPGRRYQALGHLEDSPQLPSGYATMILLALVPPLWRRVMDLRLPPAPRPAA